MKDHEKRITRRNRLLNDALQAWDFDTVEQDVSEIGIKISLKIISFKHSSSILNIFLLLKSRKNSIHRGEGSYKKIGTKDPGVGTRSRGK